MRLPKTFTTLLATACLCFALAGDIAADISNAAVLFLRIAPGARPAGMGESFVAIADDATATHWNPAGLGSHPLSYSWKESKLSADLKPITALTAMRKDGGKGYLAYDLWALTAKGVARYDNKDWYLGEVFSTRTDETVEEKVRAYFSISDDEKINAVIRKVARANNDLNYEYLVNLRDTVMVNVPENYNLLESLSKGFDSLIAGYDRCLVNWSRVTETYQQFANGMKDGSLSEQEIDKINFAVERARTKFIPEDLTIPYSAILEGDALDIAASLDLMLVSTTENLYAYDGRRWRPLHTAGDSVQYYSKVNTLFALDKHILVGTDQGLMLYSGAKVRPIEKSEQLPAGNVTAIGAHDIGDIWVVVENDLYHYNGNNWSNTRQYTAVLDDTPEAIAEKFSIYGTAADKQLYVSKLKEANRKVDQPDPRELVGEDGERKGLLELMQEMKQDENTDSEDSAVVVEEDAAEVNDPVDGESEIEVAEESTTPVVTEVTQVVQEFTVNPGDLIRVPYLSTIKGQVHAIHVSFDDIWLGTEYGIVHYNGQKWQLPGYRDTVITESATASQVTSSVILSDSSKMDGFLKRITALNDITDGQIASNTTIKVPRNRLSSRVNEIAQRENKVFVATTEGLLEYDGKQWNRPDLKDMDKSNAIDIRAIDNELWVANDEKVLIKANGRTDLSTMYVKWLPELADDLYYVFIAGVTPVSGWGTLGLSGTFISYGKFSRTLESGPTIVDEFESFDFAGAVSFGTALSEKFSVGVSAKIIYSKLSDQGAGIEQGSGTSTGFAVDAGVLYRMSSRLTWGAALTNIGPKMTYIDAAQADELPRNFAFGFAYKLVQSEYYRFLVTMEMNKILVGVDDGLSQELKETVFNGGVEFVYANLFAARAGYIYDQEGNVKNLTLGAGLSPLENMRFDFSYIPSGSSSVLANTLRLSLSIVP